MKAKIRLAQLHDAPAILDLLTQMHDEVGKASLDIGKVAWTIDDVVKNHIALVADADGDIVGSTGIVAGKPWYSSDDWFFDRWFYVRPDARGSRIAESMIKRANKLARAGGLPLAMGVTTDVDVERKNALFRRYMTPFGEQFLGGATDVLRR